MTAAEPILDTRLVDLNAKRDPRFLAASIVLDIMEDEWLKDKRFKGQAQLQRILEYIVNTE